MYLSEKIIALKSYGSITISIKPDIGKLSDYLLDSLTISLRVV